MRDREPKAGDIIACDWETAVVLSTKHYNNGRMSVRLFTVAAFASAPYDNHIWMDWYTLSTYWSVVPDGPALEWLVRSEHKFKIILDEGK